MAVCAAPACTAPAKAGQLMCLACWRRTPMPLQRVVNRTWRAMGRSAESIVEYRIARDAAVDWHRENPLSKQRTFL